MKKSQTAAAPVTMNEVFEHMRHVEDEFGCRLGLALWPVQNGLFDAAFGLTVKVYGSDNRCIREVSNSHTYWPSNKYDSWEAAALSLVRSVETQLRTEFFPLFQFIAR